MRWRLLRPKSWTPHAMEEIIYRPPDGGRVRAGRMIGCEVRPGHHRIAIGRLRFDADIRDVFPMPGWKREMEVAAMEREEGVTPESPSPAGASSPRSGIERA
jgi:hypothetical protein